MPVRFSDYFGLRRSQAELDFVDIPLDTDIGLCVDPYALSILDSDPWFVESNNLVVDFFQMVVDSILNGQPDVAMGLLSHLQEPNETRLGFSRKRPAGRGIGRAQALELYERLSRSRAVRTGRLRDLYDCELLIPGISGDKISDITVNVIRGQLIAYTQAQCNLLGIPMSEVPTRPCWDAEAHRWEARYARLPVYEGHGAILTPKAAVRVRLVVDHRDYYAHHVIPELQRQYLIAEHVDPAVGLVKTLRNGKKVVRKKDVAKQHPCSKEFLFDFSEAHPATLDGYRASLPRRANLISNEDIEAVHPIRAGQHMQGLLGRLGAIEPGPAGASDYQDAVLGIIEAVFYPDLRNPKKEAALHSGRKRVDIRFTNAATGGFFRRLLAAIHIPCPYVFIECKNYSMDPRNPELDQLAGRFSDTRGRVGILACRAVRERSVMLDRCRDVLHDGRGLVLVLEDTDLEALVSMRIRGDGDSITDFLDDRLAEVVM